VCVIRDCHLQFCFWGVYEESLHTSITTAWSFSADHWPPLEGTVHQWSNVINELCLVILVWLTCFLLILNVSLIMYVVFCISSLKLQWTKDSLKNTFEIAGAWRHKPPCNQSDQRVIDNQWISEWVLCVFYQTGEQMYIKLINVIAYSSTWWNVRIWSLCYDQTHC